MAGGAGDPGHLIELGHSGWHVWRSFCVRRAGMPYSWLDIEPESTFTGAHRAALCALRRAVAEKSFREAVVWQNPVAASRILGGVDASGKRLRKNSRPLAAYLSRYVAKNDTVGFFGPSGWGEWTDGRTRVGVVGMPDRDGAVFLELWAVHAIADALIERHGLWPWTVPHRAPATALDGDGAVGFDGSRLRLNGVQRSVLLACDGMRRIADVVTECAGHPADAVRREIRRMQATGLLTRGFALSQSRRPADQLRVQLTRVGDTSARAAALRDLDRLTAAVAGVAGAAGDPDALADALARLDEVFQELTDKSAHRKEGMYYAGRTVIYHDCATTEQVQLEVGILDAIAPALELLLTSARWFAAEVADRYLAHAWQVMTADPARLADGYPFARLVEELADSFWSGQQSFWAGDPRPVDAAVAELRRRWTAIVAPDPSRRRMSVRSDQIRARVVRDFTADRPAWPSARWHSPDLMIAATDEQALAAGRFLAVLGEMHATTNSIDQLVFFESHPRKADLGTWIDRDVPDRIVPLYPFGAGRINSRTSPPPAHRSPRHVYLGIGTEPPYSPQRAKILPSGALRVHLRSGRLVVRSVVDDFAADLVEVLDDYLSTAACSRFTFLAPAPHQPRVAIDNVVVSRETWRVPYDAIRVTGSRLAQAYAEVQRLRRTHGLPRRVFCRFSGEVKPVHVDFDNPLLVDVFLAKLRRGRERVPDGQLVLTEMLPDPEQLWLRDAESLRYTSEIRLVCVDGQRYQRGAGSPRFSP